MVWLARWTLVALAGGSGCAHAPAKPASAPDDCDPADRGAPAVATVERVERVPTRPGVTVPVLVREPAGPPHAVVLLYPGGGGHLALTAAGLGRGADNFTVRTRGEFARAGLVAVVVDAPSDHRESLSAFRITTDAAQDTAKLAEWAAARWQRPVWLIGTSRGTISVGNAASRGVAVQGIVLTSSVTTGARERATLGDVAVEHIAVPTLLVHHAQDGCNASPLAGAVTLRARLVNAPEVSWREISGGKTCHRAAECSPRSHHGYLGQDVEVVGIITDYLRNVTTASDLVHERRPAARAATGARGLEVDAAGSVAPRSRR